jgi:hypothetical protein
MEEKHMLLIIVQLLTTRDMIVLVSFGQKKIVVISLGLNMALWFQGMQKNKPRLG